MSSSPFSPAGAAHAVQFYKDDWLLEETVSEFLAQGISVGHPLLVVASAARRSHLLDRLNQRIAGFEELRKQGRVTCLDARDTLSCFMSDGMPDAERFTQTLAPVVERVLREQRTDHLRAYGEMVDLLWKDGESAAAIRLEELWNDLASKYSFSLLCAYSMGNFYRGSDIGDFQRICDCHDHVLPVESDRATPREMSTVELAVLQQRAEALEHEIAQRERLEIALRDALATSRKAEDDLRALAEQAARLAAIVQSSDDAIVRKTLDGIIESWNPAAERLFGYTAEEAIGRSIRMIVPADRQAEEDEVLRRIRVGESVNHYETVRQRKDGSFVPISLTVSPIHDREGRVIAASKIARDISQRLEFEALRAHLLDEERRAREEANRANRIKEEFLALLSHELRTPLNAILGWTQIAMSAQHDLDPNAANVAMRRAIEVIERNASAQARLVDDLLDISRVVSGKLELNTKPLDLVALARSVAESARPTATAKKLQFDVRLPDADVWVNGDATRLQQVIWNLLSNAMKFTPAGGIVELEIIHAGGEARITVRDTGAGISPAFLPHVFDRFRQDDTSTARRHGGLGIGLSVVKHLVEAHDGTVVAKSPGKDLGATFTIGLPLIAARRETDVSAPAIDDVLTGVSIVVVDDEPDAREMLFHLLTTRGAKVTVATSAGEAMAALVQEPHDVLLADLGMPVEDGYSLITALRNHQRPQVRRVRAIAVTAYTSDQARRRALVGGYDGYVTKPFDFDRLLACITNGIDSASGVVQDVQEERAQA